MKQVDPTTRALLLILVAVLSSLPAAATEERSGWSLRFNGIATDPGGGSDGSRSGNEQVNIRFDSGFGVAGSAEYRWSTRFGVELGALGGVESDVRFGPTVGPEAGSTFGSVGALSYSALTAGLNIHLTPAKRVEIYAGPILARIVYSDFQVNFGLGLDIGFGLDGLTVQVDETINLPAVIEIDDDLALGAVVGLDAPLGTGGWSFNGAIKYLDTGAEGSLGGSVSEFGFDPLILGIGFGYRF